MKKFSCFLPVGLATLLAFGSLPVFAGDELEGDEALACEALLCLAAPTRPGECARSIKKFFSIKFREPWKTIAARKDFLHLCPVVGMDPLIDAFAEGAELCDSQNLGGLNTYSPQFGFVINDLPSSCGVYQRVLADYGFVVDLPIRKTFCFEIFNPPGGGFQPEGLQCESLWTNPEDDSATCQFITNSVNVPPGLITDQDGNRLCVP